MLVFKRKQNVAEPSLRRRSRQEQATAAKPMASRSTLTSKPNAFSYHNRRSDQQENTGRRLDRQAFQPAAETLNKLASFWLQRFGLAILLVVGVVSLASISTLSSQPQIAVVNKNQTSLFASNLPTYQTAANKLFASSSFNHNKLTANTTKISQQLESQFPEIQAATITLPLISHKPIIYIQYAQPALILVNASGSFILDTNGRAIASNTLSATTSQQLPVVVDHSGLTLARGRQVLSSSDISFIKTVLAELAAKQINTSSLSLPAVASELDVAIAGQPYFVKFNLHASTDDAKLQAGTFIATQNHLKIQNITPASYIDVRVDGRAYYK